MSDSAVYKFMFTADVETYTGEPGVTLTVTGQQLFLLTSE